MYYIMAVLVNTLNFLCVAIVQKKLSIDKLVLGTSKYIWPCNLLSGACLYMIIWLIFINEGLVCVIECGNVQV
jgi:hypothetical protein